MKRTFCFLIICVAALAIIIGTVPRTANAWKPKLPGGIGEKKQDEGKSVSMEDIKTEDKEIRIMVANATSSFLKGSSNVFEAVKDKASAEKCRKTAEDLANNPEDPQQIKNSMQEADEINKKLKELTQQQAEFSEESKKLLGMGAIYVGAGGYLDAKAGDRSTGFLDKLKSAMTTVKANPTKYGVGAMGTLKESFDLMKFLSSNLPKQGANIGTTFTKLIDFAKANGVSVSDSDAKKAAEDIDKKG